MGGSDRASERSVGVENAAFFGCRIWMSLCARYGAEHGMEMK